MGRRKCHATPAERSAAYRRRLHAETVVVDRERLTRLEDRLAAFHAALHQAKQAGHPLARQVCHASLDTTLEALTVWFTTPGKEGHLPMT